MVPTVAQRICHAYICTLKKTNGKSCTQTMKKKQLVNTQIKLWHDSLLQVQIYTVKPG